MAITIRNKETEAMISQLGERWGTGPSAVVRRLVEQELARGGKVATAEFERRMKMWDEVMAIVPELTEAEKRDMQYELDHMYDYLDEEPDQKGSQAAE